jgi:hypothetical protein
VPQPHRTPPGLRSQAVRRDALAQATAAEAVRAIVSRPAVGGRAYLLADAAGDVVTVEVAAETGPSVTAAGLSSRFS